MENRTTTLQPTSDLRLDFFSSPARATLDTVRRAKAQIAPSSECVQCFSRQQDFVQCDC